MVSKISKVFLIALLLGTFVGLSEAGIKNKARGAKTSVVKPRKGKIVPRTWKREQHIIAHLEGGQSFLKEDEYTISDLPNYLLSGTIIGYTTYDRATCYMGRSIAVGSDGILHATWADRPNMKTYYSHSTDNGETWIPRIEVHDVLEGDRCSIAIDPTNPLNIFIVYHGRLAEGENRWVRVRKSTDGGLNWEPSVNVDGPNHNPISSDIIIDSQGNPHVVFDNNNDNHVHYTYSADGGATWFEYPEIADIGAAGAAAFGPAIGLDNNGNPHVVFGNDGSPQYWGDKNMYWTWRDMSLNFWMEIPPVQLCEGEGGLGWGTMVFDSQNNLHVWYDEERLMQYRMYDWSSWSDPVDIPLYDEDTGGQMGMCSAAIDASGNQYLIYKDSSAPGGSGQAWDRWMDIFSGTNFSGEWQYVNITRVNGTVGINYCDIAREVLDDGVVHLIYTQADVEDVDPDAKVIYERAYPWPPEPECGTNQLSDTYDLTGPFSVTTATSDIDGTVESCSLFVYLNGEEILATAMTEVVAGEEYEYDFTVAGAVGDSVTYIGRATDNDGFQGESVRIFQLLEPSQPGADILLVDDDIHTQSDIVDISGFIGDVLDSLNYVYEPWNVEGHKGIDESVTSFGWSTIIISAWGASQVPTRDYTGNPFAAFLSSGTTVEPSNILYTDQDYFWINNEETMVDLIFDVGDFAYDFFGLAGGVNDDTLASRIDTLVIGEAGDPISGDWVDTPIELQFELIDTFEINWIDWTEAGTGEDIFYTYETDNGAGVKYDAGNFKTVFLPWMYEAVGTLDADSNYIPHDDAYALMENMLEWFGTDTGYAVSVGESFVEIPSGFALFQNYPNPFNPVTHIAYDLPGDSRVELSIYNLLGQKIRTLVNRDMSGGHHVAVWDGNDDLGSPVSTGIYFYRIRADDFKESRKMILLK